MNPSAEIIAIGLKLLASGRLAEADNLCRQILANAPETTDAWHLLGVVALQQDQHEQAIEHLKKASSLDNSDAEVQNSLGLAYRKKGDYQAAVVSFRRAIELRPNFTEAVYNLANCLADVNHSAKPSLLTSRRCSLIPDLLTRISTWAIFSVIKAPLTKPLFTIKRRSLFALDTRKRAWACEVDPNCWTGFGVE